MPPKKGNTNYRNQEAISRAGMKIREIRLAKQMTIEQLAIECDVDATQISRMELGKVNFTLSHLTLIAEKLGVEADLLIRKDA